MERTVTATEARVHFGELMRRVTEQHETIIVERGGRAQVVILSLGDYQRLRDRASPPDDFDSLMHDLHDRLLARRGNAPLSPSVEEIIHQMREDRDRELNPGLH